jgi:hypothetical protein
MYWLATVLLEAIPRIGKKTRGRSAVAAKGIASVTQKMDIIMAQAAILLVCIFSPKFANNIINRGRAMPTTNPTLFIIILCYLLRKTYLCCIDRGTEMSFLMPPILREGRWKKFYVKLVKPITLGYY